MRKSHRYKKVLLIFMLFLYAALLAGFAYLMLRNRFHATAPENAAASPETVFNDGDVSGNAAASPETVVNGGNVSGNALNEVHGEASAYASGSQLLLHYRPADYSEGNALLDNPYRGFYQMRGFLLSEESTVSYARRYQQYIIFSSNQLMLIEINLRNYSASDLSANALEQLDAILSELALGKKQVILRVLYDWDGAALTREPSNIEQIMSHMEQVAEVVNAHADAIFTMQGVFTGNYGEMNSSNFGSPEDNALLINHLASVTDPSIYLAFRTPAQLRGAVQTMTPISEGTAYDGSLASRLGLYNDGMLGSVFDLGTYDDTPFADTEDNPGDKGTREEEIAFQDYLCQYVPNGGEVVIDNPCNDLENAISDLRNMHVSYLNKEYDSAVLDKWKNTVYHGDDCFDGMSGYDYISAHLGYRYVISGSDISCRGRDISAAKLSLTIQNTGFAPAYRLFEGELLLENADTELLLPISLDNRTIKAGSEASFTVSLDLGGMEAGTYNVFFSLTDPYTEKKILFANEGAGKSGWINLGTLTIEQTSP